MTMSGPAPAAAPRAHPPSNLTVLTARRTRLSMFPFGRERDAVGGEGLARHLSPALHLKANAELPPATGAGLLTVLHGVIARYALSRSGKRRIVGLLAAGDVCCDRAFCQPDADGFVALTDCLVAGLPVADAYRLVQECPTVGWAIWRVGARSSGIYREWLRTQSLPGENRLAHRLCEVMSRTACAQSPTGVLVPRFRLETWADMTALTAVHVSRCLTAMAGTGLIALETRSIRIPEPAALAAYAEFDLTYLWPNAPLPADELGRAIAQGQNPEPGTPFD